MPDDRDHNSELPQGGYRRATGEGAGRRRGEDPLAELARLIDEDPFADFDRARQVRGKEEPEPFADQAEPEAVHPPAEQAWPQAPDGAGEYHPAHASDAFAPDDGQDYVASDPQASDTGNQPEVREPFDEPADRWQDARREDDWPEAGQLAGDHHAFDAASALEAELFASDPHDAAEGTGWGELYDVGSVAAGEPAPRDIVRADLPDPAFAEYEAAASHSQQWEGDHPPRRHEESDPAYEPRHAGDDEYYAADPTYAEYAEDGHPPIAALNEGEPRSRRGLAVVGSLVALVVLGGAVALGYRGLVGDPTGEPPVIRADAGPTKVMAEVEEVAEAGEQGKLVYDRIGGAQQEREERLVSREEPVFEVEGREQPVRRVELDPGLRAGAEETARAQTRVVVDEPRRVRTVVVRPDGTVVSPPEPEAAADEVDAAAAAPAEEPEVVGEAGAQTADAETADAEADETIALAPASEPAEEAEPAFVPPSAEEAAAPRQPQGQGEQPRSGQPLQLVPAAGDAQTTGPTQTAAVPPATAQTFPSGSYVVQVASTRSEEEARGAASSLAERHASVLGDYQTGVERADLGDRGIFYRIGVGPVVSQSDANALCDRLKANGLDCFVRRN